MNKVELLKAVEDGYNLLTKEETLEEKSFKLGCKYAVNKMFYILKSSEQELERYKNIIDELEKYLKEENKFDEYKDITYRETMGYVLDKLKELKGSDK